MAKMMVSNTLNRKNWGKEEDDGAGGEIPCSDVPRR